MLFILIPAVGSVVVLVGWMMLRLAARSDDADARALVEWLRSGSLAEEEKRPSAQPPVDPRHRATG